MAKGAGEHLPLTAVSLIQPADHPLIGPVPPAAAPLSGLRWLTSALGLFAAGSASQTFPAHRDTWGLQSEVPLGSPYVTTQVG